MKLAIKIGGGFLTILVLLTFMGYFNLKTIQRMNKITKHYEKLDNVVRVINEDVKQNLFKILNAFHTYTLAPTKENKDKVYKYLKLAKTGTVKWKKSAKDIPEAENTANKIQTFLAQVRKDMDKYFYKKTNVKNTHSENDQAEMKKISQTIKIYMGKANKLLDNLIKHGIDPQKAALSKSVLEKGREDKYVIAIVTLGGLFLGIIIATATTLSITKPVKKVLITAKEIAKENLSKEILSQINLKGSDEIAEMAQALRHMLDGVIGRGQSVINGIPDPFIMMDLDLNVTYMNEACAALTGFTADEAVGILKCDKIFNPHNLPVNEVYNILLESKKTGSAISGKKAEIKNRKGENIPLNISCAPLMDLSGNMTGMIMLFNDITEDVNREKTIEKNHELLLEVAGEVQKVADQVATAAEILSSQSEEIAAGAEEQSAQANQVAAAVEEMNATIAEVAKSAQEAADQAGETREVAFQGSEVVENSVEKIKRLSETSQQVAESIGSLAEKSQEIDRVIDVISDIADQTNLLALNATIEAASAGEAGKGFAVVAGEVKELAKQTAQSTESVREAIEQIQEGIRQSVTMIEETLGEVKEASSLASKAGTSLGEIVEKVDNTADMVTGIAAAAQQQSAAVGEISKNMDGIMTVSHQTAQGIVNTTTAVKELAALAEQLKLTVQKFNAQG